MTLYSAEFNTPGTTATVFLRLDLTIEETDIAGNRSKIAFNAYLDKTSSAGTPSHDATNDTVFTANSVQRFNIGNHSYSFSTGTGTRAIQSGSFWVDHEPDGTKTLSFTLTYADSGAQIIGTATINNSMVLPAIPRGPYVKVDGVWKRTVAYVKVDGVWKVAVPYIKVDGVWKVGS